MKESFLNDHQYEALIGYIGALMEINTPEHLIYSSCKLWLFKAVPNYTSEQEEEFDGYVEYLVEWFRGLKNEVQISSH